MQTSTPQNLMPIWLGKIPTEGGIVIPLKLTFDGSNTPIEVDLNPAQFGGHFSAFQTFYIDNEANGNETVFQFEGSQQRISIPAAAQAYMPVLQPNPPKLFITTASAITLTIHLINFFLPPAVWNTGSCCVTVTDDVHTVSDISSLAFVGATVSGVSPNAIVTIPSGATGANPTATAGPAAINGVAATFMRSDAAPAIQKGTNAQFGIVEVDNTTITSAAGVISAVAQTITKNTTVTSGFATGDLLTNNAGVVSSVPDVAVNQVLVSGGVGANPSYSAAPVVTSIKFGSGTVLNDYEEGTWTPTDVSGASLSITNNRSTYTKIGRQVTLQMNINYPATANGSASKIGSVPFSIPSLVVLGDPLTTNAAVFYAYTSSSGTTFNILTAAGAPVVNSGLSNSIVQGNIFYPAT